MVLAYKRVCAKTIPRRRWHEREFSERDRKHRSEQNRITPHSSLARRHGSQSILTGTERLRGIGNRAGIKTRPNDGTRVLALMFCLAMDGNDSASATPSQAYSVEKCTHDSGRYISACYIRKFFRNGTKCAAHGPVGGYEFVSESASVLFLPKPWDTQ